MNLKLGNFEFNNYAVAVTCFFILYLVIRSIYFFSLPASSSALLDSLIRVPLILESIVGGVAGLKASHLFGGRRNFTGRLLFSFSLLIFFYMAGLVLVNLEVLNILTASFYLEVLFADTGFGWWILGLQWCFPAYALVASVRSTWDKFDSKSLLVVFFSFAFALMVGWVNLVWADPVGGTTTFADTILWVGIMPTLTFLEMSSGVLLLMSLGKWYVKKGIAALVFAVLFGVVIFAILNSIGWAWFAVAYNPHFATYVWVQLIGNFSAFLICIALTQFKARMTGPFF